MSSAHAMPPPPRDMIWQKIQPWFVVLSASLFFFFEFMQVNIFNAMSTPLYNAYHLANATQLGNLSACYMYATVIFLFPAGILLDYFSTRRIVLIAMAICVFCTLLFSLTNALWQAQLCRLIIGAGGAFCFISSVRLASRWFEAERMALVIGLVVTLAMIGATLAQTPFTLMTTHLGWRSTLRIDASIGVFMLLLIFIFVRDFPKDTQSFHQAQYRSLEKIGFWHSLVMVIKNSQNWLGGLYVSLINLPVFLLGATWGTWYLIQTQGLSQINASFVTSALFVGMIIGSPAVGWLSDRIARRKMPMILGAILSLATILLIMYSPHLSFSALLILFFILGFVISFQVLGYPLVAESNPASLTGTAEGLASVLIMAGGFLIPTFSYLLDIDWDHRMTDHIPLYTLNDYQHGFMIMPIAFVLALIIAFCVRETHGHALEDQ